MAKKQFKCNVCGYVHEGAAAPDTCPVCGAPASEFTELKGKKGLFGDTNSNAYIVLYSTVMVVVVATLLALAALGLQKRQAENELNEKKQAILGSLAAQGESYDEFIDAYVVDAEGRAIFSPCSTTCRALLPRASSRSSRPATAAWSFPLRAWASGDRCGDTSPWRRI